MPRTLRGRRPCAVSHGRGQCGDNRSGSRGGGRRRWTGSPFPGVRNTHLNIYLEQIHFNEFSVKLNQLTEPHFGDQKWEMNARGNLLISASGLLEPGAMARGWVRHSWSRRGVPSWAPSPISTPGKADSEKLRKCGHSQQEARVTRRVQSQPRRRQTENTQRTVSRLWPNALSSVLSRRKSSSQWIRPMGIFHQSWGWRENLWGAASPPSRLRFGTETPAAVLPVWNDSSWKTVPRPGISPESGDTGRSSCPSKRK